MTVEIVIRFRENICSMMYASDGEGVLSAVMERHGYIDMVNYICEVAKKCKRRRPESRILRAILASHVDERTLRRLWCGEICPTEEKREEVFENEQKLFVMLGSKRRNYEPSPEQK